MNSYLFSSPRSNTLSFALAPMTLSFGHWLSLSVAAGAVLIACITTILLYTIDHPYNNEVFSSLLSFRPYALIIFSLIHHGQKRSARK